MSTAAGRTAGRARQRSVEVLLGRLGQEIDQIAERAAACRADVRTTVQGRLDRLRQRQSRARDHLRRQARADQLTGDAGDAELAWDLGEMDVELSIAGAALDAELAADAAAYAIAAQRELDAWNDWIGLAHARVARGPDPSDGAEALTRPARQRWAAASGRLHRFRAGGPEATGQARDGVEQAMAELRQAADEVAARVDEQRIGNRPSGAWPAPTAGEVHGTRDRAVRGWLPPWMAGWGWPAPGWTVAFGILTVAAGVAVLVWPKATLIVLALILGAQLLVAGVFWFLSAFSVRDSGVGAMVALTGVLGVLLGLLIVGFPMQTIAALVLLLGLYWTIAGLVQLVHGIRGDVPSRGWTIAAGALGAAAGIAVLLYPAPSALVLTLMFGILLVLYGALLVAEGIHRGRRRHVAVSRRR
jgi:uncharacterized membrane protein HdeD (DUF308 family)